MYLAIVSLEKTPCELLAKALSRLIDVVPRDRIQCVHRAPSISTVVDVRSSQRH
jgi:hypothetical protein